MRTVVIDPGHGGTAAAGGSSPNNATGPNGLLEKDVTLDLGRRVAAALAPRADVVLTRAGDENRSLAERAKVGRDHNADVFVSIHLNGFADPAVDGSEAWVAKHAGDASRLLARTVLTRVVGVTQARDRGVKEEDFGVIRADRQAPGTAASLVEVAFLTNAAEAERLTHDEYRQAIAQAIADGIAERLPSDAVAQSLSGGAPPAASIFLVPNLSLDYTDYVQPVTRGDLEPLINGRSTNPPIDRTEPLDQMQAFVASTTAGDSVYLSAWYFEPATPLTGGPYRGLPSWGGLLAAKALEGVNVRVLCTDFDSLMDGSHQAVRLWMSVLDRYLDRLPPSARDNLQYVVSLHSATYGVTRAIFAGRSSVHIGSHHQKFMVVKRGEETVAFCGGLDIESRKTPAKWSYGGLVGWHDLHVKLRGPIARDFEKEFALRWNREAGSSTVAPPTSVWSGYATLPVPVAPVDGEIDAEPARRQEDVQMERTVSSDATFQAFTTNQDNNREVYKRIVGAARSFVYFENQYFRSLDLADWIVAQARAIPSLPVIIVVMSPSSNDDKDDEVTQEGTHLQHEFFDRVTNALGARAAIYTMANRSVHSKFLLADDRYMTIGSANANERSFQLDSELNVAVDDAKLTTSFRKRLWAHNLGLTEAAVGAWSVGDFIAQWEAVASANDARGLTDMAGEGVIHWDYRSFPGTSHVYIPDYLAEVDADHGDEPDGAGLVAVNDAIGPDDLGALTDGTAIA